MKTIRLTLPVFASVVATRAILAAGVALLLADRLDADQRKAIGWTMALIGAISTIPLGIQVFGKGANSFSP